MRWFVFLLCLVVQLRAAEPGEAEAFLAAAKASQDGLHERAEKAWADFLNRFPKSERVPDAGLALAQARHQLKQYSAALELLDARLPQAGALADQYQFWRGQALLDATNFTGAEAAFDQVVKVYTNSPLRLGASVRQAQTRLRREDFAGVVELLGNTNSVFHALAQSSTNVAEVTRGYLTLAEAQFRRSEIAAARATLQELGARTLAPDLAWERTQLLGRVLMAGPSPIEAIPVLTNALGQARATGRPLLVAQTLNLEADLFQRLNQPARAAQSYEGVIAAEGMPADQKRTALLRAVELSAQQNAFTNAASRLTLYLTQNSQDPSADFLNIKAGEYLLEAYRQQTNKMAAPGTNLIVEARAYFDRTLQQFTNSPLVGKAWLNRGWALWEERMATGNGQRLADSLAAFQNAAEKLPAGDEQIQARVKVADAQFEQGAFGAAATNYQSIVQNFATGPKTGSNLVAQAAEQLVRSHLAQTNMAAAEAALQQCAALFAGNRFVETGWLMVGQTCAELGDFEKARAILKKFPEQFPQSALRPEADLAFARTFAMEQKWPQAIELFTLWTSTNATHALAPQAEFDRAWFHARAGQPTNAFQLFTNFVARFPTNALAARAQDWVGNHFYYQEQWSLAEQSYQRVFQNTNWNVPELACQARLMAARTAYFRQGYGDARSYLTNIINSACSPEVVAEAWFILGDVLIIEQRAASPTNAINFSEAVVAFDRITRLGATNGLETLALGKMGDCYLQLASIDPASYEKATNAYQRVLDSKRPDVPIAARNQAEVGIALVMEKQAERLPENRARERKELLKAALNRYVNVVYAEGLPEGKRPDPYWQRRAALSAGRLAEIVTPEAARALYERFIREIPALKTSWETKLNALPPSSGQ